MTIGWQEHCDLVHQIHATQCLHRLRCVVVEASMLFGIPGPTLRMALMTSRQLRAYLEVISVKQSPAAFLRVHGHESDKFS